MKKLSDETRREIARRVMDLLRDQPPDDIQQLKEILEELRCFEPGPADGLIDLIQTTIDLFERDGL